MPIDFRIDPAARRVRFHVTDMLLGSDIVSACVSALNDPEHEPGFSTLWDMRRVTGVVLTTEDLVDFEAVAPMIGERRGPGRSAFVTGSPDAKLTALLLSLKTLACPKGTRGTDGPGCMRNEDRSTRVFEDLESAEAWLAQGVPTME